MLRSNFSVTAFPNNQQTNFWKSHLRDAVLRFFQTLPVETRQKLTAILKIQQPNFSQLHLSDAALVLFQTLPLR